ncbi:MAG: polysaccharide deacetylase family protein [Oscillospiraceae bacterium]|nr:polysaccharide deacetylase family protein [Oscillospiraceae bacterium]
MEKLDIFIIIFAIALALALLLAGFGGAVLETGSWGLSFGITGQTPAGNATKEELARYGGAYVGDEGEQVLYLTFDAGYENGFTPAILDTLKKHQVPAAFFLVGHYLKENPDLVRRMVSEGHTVGNHTMHHPDMSKITDFESFSKELQELEGLYREITGAEMPKFYRPPQGIYSQENLEMAQKLGYKTVFWSLAYADWDNENQPSPETAMEKLTGRVHNGAVILLHSTSKTNAQVLDQLITRWKEMGYRFGTLEELVS